MSAYRIASHCRMYFAKSNQGLQCLLTESLDNVECILHSLIKTLSAYIIAEYSRMYFA